MDFGFENIKGGVSKNHSSDVQNRVLDEWVDVKFRFWGVGVSKSGLAKITRGVPSLL